MSRHSVVFGGPGAGLALANAILLYRGASADGDRHAFASIHSVELDDDGGPTISAGTPLTRAHLREWTEALGRAAKPEILPEHILVAHADMIVWWVPAQVRPAFFALSAPPPGLRLLSGETSVSVPYPAHLMVATRSRLGVYALRENQRPTSDTPVFHSPILNVFANGQLCWGNIDRPSSLDIASIPQFERAVFDSWSTHPNPGQEFTITGKGGLVRLWDDLAARRAKRFPVGRLKLFRDDARRQASRPSEPLTVGKLVARGGGR